MLTFEEKLAIIEEFLELERKNVSLKRVNFHFEGSADDKKNVVYHLHPNGNGFVFAGKLGGYETDSKGMVNIRDYSKEELRHLLKEAIESLKPNPHEEAVIGEAEEERWVNDEKHTLILVEEDDMWNVYAGLNLDGTFPSYNEARQYLEEEGFSRRK
ncbi:hypothetical protein [Bacillus sp. FJAT-27251]|uniref:hypothetical protein n=1 Tax=Bacillus sp. FJAT-27251 TaxID=1684142 RepID=UPI0006A78AB8|nr:hypothetical protein [Bacillus sp. FJAT-27251]